MYHFMQLSDMLLTAGQPTRDQLVAAARAGVQAVINLALSTSEGALPDEVGLVHSLGMEYIHIPVLWEHPGRSDLECFMDVMDARQGQKLLVHCVANYRVSCFVALWRVLRHGWEAGLAFTFMRRIWDPDGYPAWKAFMADCLGGGMDG